MRYLILLVALGTGIGCAARVDEGQSPNNSPLNGVQTVKSDREQVFDAILNDIVTNLEDVHDFYGTPGDKRLALVSAKNYGVLWPEAYKSSVPGYATVRIVWSDDSDKIDPHSMRLLGVRIDDFPADLSVENSLYWGVRITLYNAGGEKNGATIGECSVIYTPKKTKNRWMVVRE